MILDGERLWQRLHALSPQEAVAKRCSDGVSPEASFDRNQTDTAL
ncbi:hypothetical protein C8P66_105138 [Humitalea rosea]|uniref:Uncharacterized protein n=1 Tax=Humitalea rosea TaxID=990373 RepID=A0A2W7KK15_9PROT|nr:hypothetical protein C8P66_105138 [Humitalea rosea]